MSSVTEIYVCKLRQEMKSGKLFTSNDIHSRHDAEMDARERCGFDDSIAKIGYYGVEGDVSYKIILMYENPNVDRTSEPPVEESGAQPPGREKLMASAQQAHAAAAEGDKPRHSLFSKVMTFFTEEAGS